MINYSSYNDVWGISPDISNKNNEKVNDTDNIKYENFTASDSSENTKCEYIEHILNCDKCIEKLRKELKFYNKVEVNETATLQNGEPLAFSTSEMGSTLSDNYSYLDMSSEDLAAKGNGGLRMMHNYTTISDNQVIATPPDDYEPNKVGDVDMSKLEAERNQEIHISQ